MRILKAGLVLVVTLNLTFAPPSTWAFSGEGDESERHSGPSPLFAAMIAASSADVASTELGLARGMSEANPLARHRGVRIAAHAGGVALAWYATEKLRKAGHPRAALIARIGFIAAYGYATAHNLRATYAAR